MPDSHPQPRTQRRRRNRKATEEALLSAARRLLEERGVLSGFSLLDVAKEAGVNRGQIYQYFGTRGDLLRIALKEMSDARGSKQSGEFAQPFAQQRVQVFREALSRQTEIRLEALLAIDGESHLGLFPILPEALARWELDKTQGNLPADADTAALHTLSAATYLGYVIFRQAFADELNLAPSELDERVIESFSRLLEVYSASPEN